MEALGKIGDSRAVEHLIKALKHESWKLRWKAAETLGEIGDRKAVEHLTKALKDRDIQVRKAAKTAIQQIEQMQQ
jgi:HEAT repeat protein